MIKSELILALSKQLTHLPETQIKDSVNYILDLMSHTLEEGHRIEIRGFGSFSSNYYSPRNARNPKTGEKVITRSIYAARFKPGKILKKLINKQAVMIK